LKTSSKAYHDLHPLAALLLSYVVFTGLTGLGAYFMRWNVKRYLKSFTVSFS